MPAIEITSLYAEGRNRVPYGVLNQLVALTAAPTAAQKTLTCVRMTADMSPKSTIAAENLCEVNNRAAHKTSKLPSDMQPVTGTDIQGRPAAWKSMTSAGGPGEWAGGGGERE